MWSLPNIQKLNEDAAKARQRIERALKTGKLDGKKIGCEQSMFDKENCRGKVALRPWRDIFSDDPKGIIAECEGHAGASAGQYFDCADCGATYADHYTGERYQHVTAEGQVICLNCFAKRVLGNPGHKAWVSTAEGSAVTLDTLAHAPHIMATDGPRHGLRLLGDMEFDVARREVLSGGGVEAINEMIARARADGYPRVMLVAHAEYEYAVSIGVYVRPEDRQPAA